MAKIDTLFMSKTAELFGAAHAYIAHIREYPPPPAPGVLPNVRLDTPGVGVTLS